MEDGDRPGVGRRHGNGNGERDWEFVDSNLTETTNGAGPPRTIRDLDSFADSFAASWGDPWPASRTSETIDARNAGEGKRSSVAAAERKDGSENRDKETREWAGAGEVGARRGGVEA